MRKKYQNIGANLDPESLEDQKRIDAWGRWKQQHRPVNVLRWLIDTGVALENEKAALEKERQKLEEMRQDLQRVIREGEHQAEQHALVQIREDVQHILHILSDVDVSQRAFSGESLEQERSGLVSLDDAARFL